VETNEQPTGAVVLGMHRSGTSAVAGFLAKAGFYAGEEDELLPAAEDNPKGFFERTDVNALNDHLLEELGGAWDKPPSRAIVAERTPAWRGRVEEVLAGLDAGAGNRPLVLKDPRISLLLPAWLPVLASRFAIVLVDRNPVDVALSVRRRDKRPLYVALALWQIYCTELLAGLAGRRVLVVRYENFVADPGRNAQLLLDRLAEALPVEGADAGRAQGFVSGDMRHHQTGPRDAANEQVLTAAQLALYRWWAGLPEGWAELSAPAEMGAEPGSALVTAAEYYDAVADRFGMETAYDTERHKALHFEQATELKDQHIANLEGALGGLRRQVDEQAGRLAALEAQVEEMEGSNEALRHQLRTLREDGRAAVGNLLAVAKRGWSSRPAG
jgi:hypothetical protein